MSYGKFLAYNLIGGIGWVCSMILIGFWLGHSIPHVDQHVHKIILVIIVLSLLPMAREIWRERRAARGGKQ